MADNQRSSVLRGVAVVVGAALLLALAIRLAWLGDDAYITLRTVENWASGSGLRWNTLDRVQVFTHPLWMVLLTIGRVSSGEVYFTTLAISLVLSMSAVIWLLLRAGTLPAVIAVWSLLATARAFGDYTTSGLETPLTFVLLVAFVATVVGGGLAPARRYGRAVLLASLLATNRMDLALLCLPAVLATMRGVGARDVVVRGALGAAPFGLWILLALVWFGSPFPVTAHAKAFGVGIPAGEIAVQGLRYLWHALCFDPVLFVVAVAGPVWLLAPRDTRWLGLGALCYAGYVVKVGGDFMQGRFLLPPFVVVVACAGRLLTARRVAWISAGVALLLQFAAGMPPWLRSPAADQPLSLETIDAQHGIADERVMYYRGLGLLSPTREIPVFGVLTAQAFPEGRAERWFLVNGAVGAAGYGAGAQCHVIDPLLCDPLIARLPARDPGHWRIGHVLRRIPEGYYESLATGENRIVHPGLHRYYEALRLATQAPVFAGERWAALWRLGTGALDGDFRAFVAEHYRTPPRLELPAGELTEELVAGAYWFDEPRIRLVYDGGVSVRFEAPLAAQELRLQTTGMVAFRCRFVRAGEVVGEVMGQVLPPPAGLGGLRAVAGLRAERVDVPAAATPFDELWVDPVEIPTSDRAPGPPGIGSLRVVR